MNIAIANRLQPFSHLPGVTTVLPGTAIQVQVFPCLLVFTSLYEKPISKKVPLHLIGPLEGFTVLNDLEKGEIRVWGKSAQGFVRYRLLTQESTVRLVVDKAPVAGFMVGDKNLKAGEGIGLLVVEAQNIKAVETLSFGNHKAQDIDLIRRRLDLSEIWPLWFKLGQMVPAFEGANPLPLLESCQQEQRPEKLHQLWLNAFQAHFHGLLAPRLIDDEHQGLLDTKVENRVSPLVLLTEGAKLIRSHFVQETGDEIHILPRLLPELHCGRFLDVNIACGTLDLEWTKKAIRRMIVHTSQDLEISFHFKHVKQFRLRRKHTDQGVIMQNGVPLLLEKNCHYFFDNFK
jgi:hypothetical protein